MFKLAAISARLIAAMSQGFGTCVKFDVNLQDFSDHVQRYRAEIAAGLHARFEVAALREKKYSEVRV